MDASVLGLEAYAEGPRRHPMTRRKLYKTSVSSRTANLELQHLSVFGTSVLNTEVKHNTSESLIKRKRLTRQAS
eukprot:g14946.t1 g14946   contig21:219508-219818(+)